MTCPDTRARQAAAAPCWCWRNNPSGEDACGFCGWPKGYHHDNGHHHNGSDREDGQP